MFCNASKILCRHLNAVSLQIPQIAADFLTDNPEIMQSTYFCQISSFFLLECVIVFVDAEKLLLQSAQKKRCIVLLNPFFRTFDELQRGQKRPVPNRFSVIKSLNEASKSLRLLIASITFLASAFGKDWILLMISFVIASVIHFIT
jgi:hypothetical protein